MRSKIPSFLLTENSPVAAVSGGGRIAMPYIDRAMKGFGQLFEHGLGQHKASSGLSFMHRLDARVKVFFWFLLIVVISIKRELFSETLILLLICSFTAASGIGFRRFLKRALFCGFVFGFLIALPSALNLFVPGRIVYELVCLDSAYSFWIYKVPQVIGITEEGMRHTGLLTLRVTNSVAISLLILGTTPFAEIIKALKIIRVPDTFLVILSMTYKYIFSFAHVVSDMYLARRARLAAPPEGREARQWVAGRVAYVFRKTRIECEEVYKAMTARGFDGEIRLYQHRRLTAADKMAALLFSALPAVIFFL